MEHKMFNSRSVMVAVIVASASIALASNAEARSCVQAGGQGTGITKEVATFMANAAMKQQMEKLGVKPSGKAKLTCTYDLVVSNCTVKQRACK